MKRESEEEIKIETCGHVDMWASGHVGMWACGHVCKTMKEGIMRRKRTKLLSLSI
jgi:hypothetical protein